MGTTTTTMGMITTMMGIITIRMGIITTRMGTTTIRLETAKRLNDEIQLQRLRVFKATMRSVQDIVNNLLSSLQFAHLEAEGLPAEMLTLVDQMIEEAGVKLKTLGNLETVKKKKWPS
jgi:hypothetical protein